jgi:hypothetical protein
LSELKCVIENIKSCTALKTPVSDTHEKILAYTKKNGVPFDIKTGLQLIDYELLIISDDPDLNESKYDSGKSSSKNDRVGAILHEEFNRNSMEFSYAFRLALMIALFEFLAVYFDLLAARWLAFTSLALCIPYVDRDLEKAKMRIKGALAGIFIFTVITLFTQDYMILTAIMLILNYIYTLFDPLRYDLKMMFANISALLTAVLILPEFGTGMEDTILRLACILGGTAIGVVVFLLITPLLTSVSTITVIMLIIGFIYAVFDPMRYVIQMAFNTVSALLTALMIMPDSPLVWERILFIAVGVGAALAANRIILPYHIKDETMDLAGKCMSVARNQIRDLGNTLRGEGDSNKNAALIVNAFAVTNKIALNNSQEPNPEVEEFLKAQYEIILNSAFMKRQMSASEIDSETKEKLLHILEKYGPDGDENLPDGIQTNGNPIVEDAVEILTYYGKCSKLSSRMMTG